MIQSGFNHDGVLKERTYQIGKDCLYIYKCKGTIRYTYKLDINYFHSDIFTLTFSACLIVKATALSFGTAIRLTY